jgi:hypothetical protein
LFFVRKKSAVRSPAKLKFLGFSLYRWKNGVGIRVYEKPLKRLMDRLSELAGRKRQTSGLTGRWDGYMKILLRFF